MSNRIVIDYHGERKLVLFAKIHTSTGNEVSYEELQKYSEYGYEIAERFHNFENFEALAALNTPNEEGFVIRFKNGLRFKIKFEDYKRLHRIVTGTSTKTIWQYLREGKSFNELLEAIPDEFFNFCKATIKELAAKYQTIEREGYALYEAAKSLPTRKDQAEYILATKSPSAFVAFKLLDGKAGECTMLHHNCVPNKNGQNMCLVDKIWSLCEPVYKQPFSSRENI